MAATLMITSKGVAGVPRASLVVILATLKQFGIPDAGYDSSFGGGVYFFWVGHSSVGLACRGLITIIIGGIGFFIFCQGPPWREGAAELATEPREELKDVGEPVAE